MEDRNGPVQIQPRTFYAWDWIFPFLTGLPCFVRFNSCFWKGFHGLPIDSTCFPCTPAHSLLSPYRSFFPARNLTGTGRSGPLVQLISRVVPHGKSSPVHSIALTPPNSISPARFTHTASQQKPDAGLHSVPYSSASFHFRTTLAFRPPSKILVS